jgi:two-component system, OmpR family, response regulator BaeR
MWRQRQILIIADKKNIVNLLTEHLKEAGFKVSIIKSCDVGIAMLNLMNPDAILLDLVESEFSILKKIRALSNAPILIISNQVDEIDRVLGFELGADDYICKPFSPREVVSRIKAILRRYNSEPSNEYLIAGPIILDLVAHNVMAGENTLKITPIEFELLKIMILKPNHVFTRSELISNIKGYRNIADGRSIDSHIKNLRKKIEEVIPRNNIIQTVYGIGYLVRVSKKGEVFTSPYRSLESSYSMNA